MSALLERESQLAAQSLRGLVADIAARRAAGEPAETVLASLPQTLDDIAGGLEHELAEIARSREPRGDARPWRNR
jgi:hypothetical protein